MLLVARSHSRVDPGSQSFHKSYMRSVYQTCAHIAGSWQQCGAPFLCVSTFGSNRAPRRSCRGFDSRAQRPPLWPQGLAFLRMLSPSSITKCLISDCARWSLPPSSFCGANPPSLVVRVICRRRRARPPPRTVVMVSSEFGDDRLQKVHPVQQAAGLLAISDTPIVCFHTFAENT